MFLSLKIFDGEGSAPFTEEDFLNKLFPNFWSFLINFLALIVLFITLYFIAYKPVKKYLDARKNAIEKNIYDAEKAKKIHEAKAEECDKMVLEAKAKGAEIVEKAKKDAALSADEIKKEALEESEKIKRQADKDIEGALEKAKASFKEEIINIALDASKEVLAKNVDEKLDKKLLKDLKDNLEGEKK